jgi:hypothetical protein
MRNIKLLWLILVVVLLLGAIACSKKEAPPEESAYPVRTEVIDGVEVITNPDYPRDGRQVYGLEEELNIGVIEGDENYLLSHPQDVKVAANGDIYVLDWTDTHILVYDKDGKYVRTAAHKGRGPGEFELPAYFDFLSDGRLVLLDGRNRQVSILDQSGAYVDGFKVEGFCTDMKVDGQDCLYFARSITPEVNASGVTQIIERKLELFCTELDGQVLYDYGTFRGGKMSYTITETGVTSGMSPYAHTTAWTVDEEGRLYAGYNENYQLSVYDPDGELLFKFGREFAPIKYEEYKGGANPEYWSAFSQYMFFDDEGNLWLWHYTVTEEETGYEYDIFSPEGIYLRQVVVPHRIYRIENGKVYSIVRDEQDYRFVKRYRMVPAPVPNK